MRFMVLMIPGNNAFEAGAMPSEQEIGAMMQYNEELVKAGVLLDADGLHPSARGARIRFSGGKKTITDGPFTEAREIIGGYWMWQCKSKEEALEWASRCPASEGDTLEIRQVFDTADFSPEVAAREAAMIEAVGKRMAENAKNAS